MARDQLTDRRVGRMKDVLSQRQLDFELVIDNVWDPHNASALLRSADGFGVGAVNLMYWTTTFPRISSTVSGYTRRWTITRRFDSADSCFDTLKAQGLTIYATGMSDDAVSYLDVDWTKPCALVLGHERDGCSPETLAAADGLVTIPMAGFAQSYNVSVAAAVLFSEAARQRRAAGMFAPMWDKWREKTLKAWIKRDHSGVPWEPKWPPVAAWGEPAARE